MQTPLMIFDRICSYIKYCWLAGVIMLAFLSPQFDNYQLENTAIISKTIFFATGVIFLILLGCLLFLKRKSFSIKITKIDVILVLLFAYTLLRVAYEGGVNNSPRFIDLLSLSCFFIFLRFSPKITFLILLYTIASVGIIQAIYGLLQLYDILPVKGQFKLTGSFFNLGAYSSFLAVSSCISLGLVLFSDNLLKEVVSNNDCIGKKKLIASLNFIPSINIALSIIILPVSLNRTAWLAFVFTAIFLYSYKKKFTHHQYSKKISTIAITITILLMLFASSVMIKRDSASGRILVWKVTMSMIKNRPLFGIGYDRFQAEYMNYQAEYLKKRGSENEKLLADNVYYGFNDILQTTAELGAIGLIIIAILIAICYRIKIKRNYYACIAKGTLIAYLITSLFYYSHQILALKILLIISLALLSKESECKPLSSFTLNVNLLRFLITLLILVPLCVSGLVYLKKLYESHLEWRNGNDAYISENYTQSLNNFNKALPNLVCNGEFLFQLGKTYLLVDSLDKAALYLKESKKYLSNTIIEIALGDLNKKLTNYPKAEVHYQTALNMVPNRFFTEYLLLQLYVDSDNKNKVCQKAKEILNKKVKVFSTAVQQILDSTKVIYSENDCIR